MELKLSIYNRDGYRLLAAGRPGRDVSLVYTASYQQGDFILLQTDTECRWCAVGLEDSLPETLLYIPGERMTFPVPWGEERSGYSPKSFTGSCHLLRARAATREEIARRRNLAFNPFDTAGETGAFPHAAASVQPQSAAFAPRNAIDGIRVNNAHGQWPYGSWGIKRDPTASLRVEFGRPVRVDELVLTLRADFPHDSWWTEATAVFSDGSAEALPLARTDAPQIFPLTPRVTTFAELRDLKKAEDASPFPALRQLEVWGADTLDPDGPEKEAEQ